MTSDALQNGFDCVSCGDEIADIVQLVEHECDEVLHVDALGSSEISTLLYVEARVVDGYAELEEARMNHEDWQNLKLFEVAGILTRGETKRASSDDVQTEHAERGEMVTPIKRFTEEAWSLAAGCRKLRGQRNL